MLLRGWYRFVGWFGTRGFVARGHPQLYRWTGGRGFIGHPLGRLTVILTTIGARSGIPREAPVWAYRDGEALVLVATNGGREPLPGWCHNLRANPVAEVLVGQERWAVRAREAEGAEWERLWSLVSADYPGYVLYRDRIHRPVPLVVLEPVGPATEGR
jgi:deazaflavin-dependent oxidoreductase (nitroreductase family)